MFQKNYCGVVRLQIPPDIAKDLCSLSNSQKVQNVIDNTDNKIINLYLIRTILSKATYDHKKKGHWALDLKFYSHFTSPIRRYPDLIVHRLIIIEY